MRAFTRAEAIQLALADADTAARKTRRMRKFFARANRIKRQPGWIPWWERNARFGTRLDGGNR